MLIQRSEHVESVCIYVHVVKAKLLKFSPILAYHIPKHRNNYSTGNDRNSRLYYTEAMVPSPCQSSGLYLVSWNESLIRRGTCTKTPEIIIATTTEREQETKTTERMKSFHPKEPNTLKMAYCTL